MFLLTFTATPRWTLAVAIVLLLALSPLWARIGIVIHHLYHTQDTWHERVQRRFAHQGTMAWMFAWFKLRLDAMFIELPAFLEQHHVAPPVSIIDIGCGYGMTGCALLEWLPNARVYGLDPSAARAKVANAAFASRGQATQGSAPDFLLPDLPTSPDAVFMLDVIHFLNDDQLQLTLTRIAQLLGPDGHLYIRAIIPPTQKKSWLWRFDIRRRKMLNIPTHHRSTDQLKECLIAAGLHVLHIGPSGGNPELAWLIACPDHSRKDSENEISVKV